jgi:hypothetical protein
MNMDYSICQATNFQSQGLPGTMLAYDIFCQWIINFSKRVDQSPFLNIPEDMLFLGGVGKFHIYGHTIGCFSVHSLNFLLGAGQMDGEILETLWSDFNKVASFARTMSHAHRREIYDDHMREWNWKKLVRIGACYKCHVLHQILHGQTIVPTLSKKHIIAIEGRDEAKKAYEEVTASINANLIEQWRPLEARAMKERGETLRIFEVQLDKRELYHFSPPIRKLMKLFVVQLHPRLKSG